MGFTFEFLPHLASGIKREADFSFYEIKWNDDGKYGFFEFQNNIPSHFGYTQDVDHRHRPSDFCIRNINGSWDLTRLSLYEKYKGTVLTQLPEDLIVYPETFLLIRLVLQFDSLQRAEIANMLNFVFPDKELEDLYFRGTNIWDIAKEYSEFIYIE